MGMNSHSTHFFFNKVKYILLYKACHRVSIIESNNVLKNLQFHSYTKIYIKYLIL